ERRGSRPSARSAMRLPDDLGCQPTRPEITVSNQWFETLGGTRWRRFERCLGPNMSFNVIGAFTPVHSRSPAPFFVNGLAAQLRARFTAAHSRSLAFRCQFRCQFTARVAGAPSAPLAWQPPRKP